MPDAAEVDELRADAADIEDFLTRYFDGRSIQLMTIHAAGDKPPSGRAFSVVGDAVAWLVKQNAAGFNCYFSATTLRSVPKSGKAKKADVAAVPWLWVDADPHDDESPEDAWARIFAVVGSARPADLPEPNIVLSSGNGVQMLWRLDEPIVMPDAEAPEWQELLSSIEDRNRWLAAQFGESGTCANLDRVLRIPGTVNWPNAVKLKAGRVPAMAELVEWLDKPVNAADDFGRLALGAGGKGGKQKTQHASRSEALWADLCARIRAGETDEVLRAYLLDREGPHAAHIYDQKVPPETYVDRQIERARESVADDWQRSDGKIIANSQHNLRRALRELGVTVSYNSFRDQMLIEGLAGVGPQFDDPALDRLYLTIDERFRFRPSQDFARLFFSDQARRNSFHPIRRYLDGLFWDGVPRLDTWLVAYGGAEDTAYVRAVGALPLVAAVRRVRQPGAKFDEMLILEGPQGTNKSSAIEVLAGGDEYFTDEFQLGMNSQKTLEAICGKWLIEVAELSGIRKGEVETIKATISRRTDRARKAYDRLVSEVPRQCVFIGSTNADRYLLDATGNRRFWPVKIERFRLEELKKDRDQLWAEAAQREATVESVRLDPALWPVAGAEQEQRKVEDPWLGLFANVLGDIEGKLLNETAWDIVGVPPQHRTQWHNERLGTALRELGWLRGTRRFEGQVRKCYYRGEDARRILIVRNATGDGTYDVQAFHEGEERPAAPDRPM